MARRPTGGLIESEALSATAGLDESMKALDTSTQQFGRSLSKALASGIVQGKSFDEILKGLGQKLIELSLKAAFKPLENGLGSLLSGLFGGVASAFSGGGGSAAFGTVPALFGGPSSQSGLPSQSAPGVPPVMITMNLTSPDAQSFLRSEAQVSAALARAVGRGQRSL